MASIVTTAPTAAREGVRAAAEDVDLWKLGTIAASLAAMTLLAHHFGLESEAFTRLLLVSLGGFLVHYFLPLRHRLPFFLALSLATLVLGLGATSSAWLVG